MESKNLRDVKQKVHVLSQYDWGYYINLEEEKEMMIPAYKLYLSPVTVFMGQKCQK